MKISVVVPAFNAALELPRLLDSLTCQTFRDFEVLVVDDGSRDRTVETAGRYPCRVLRSRSNRGPAHCRNRGAAAARGELLAFTDSDCRAASNWLERIEAHFRCQSLQALMGRVILEPSNRLGDAISALGFPAGGSIGFEKIWRVDTQGFTDSLSSCNCALRAKIFHRLGGFSEAFPLAGGEDSYLAYSLCRAGSRIRYCKDVVVSHQARNSLPGFLRWQFRRGISSYIFSHRVSRRRDFLGLRCWSTINIVRFWRRSPRLPLILTLLFAGYAAQLFGFAKAGLRRL